LVESLEQSESALIPVFHTTNEKLAEKLVRYFEYSDINSAMSYDEEEELYYVSVSSDDEKDAKKLYEGFYLVEAARIATERFSEESPEETQEETTDENDIYHTIDPDNLADTVDDSEEEEEANEDVTEYKPRPQSTTYVMKEEQYKDLNGTVWLFYAFGAAGLIVILLNVTKVIHIIDDIVPNLIMGALFLSFLYIGFSTQKKAKKVKAEIFDEIKLTERINNWLKLTITNEFLSSIHDDTLSEELNHIKKMDIIKEMIIKEFGALNLSYVDRLIDEFYNEEPDNEEFEYEE
jgi:hypothetical protein